jgi:hypothetical protein
MKNIGFLITFLMLITANSFGQKVEVVGNFMKVWTDGEHASGYNVRLWKQDKKIFGLISVHRGMMGDPPTGILENIKYDEKLETISFSVKLSLYSYYSYVGKSLKLHISKELGEFTGVLKKKKLTGTLKITDKLCKKNCIEIKKINLPLSKEWTSSMKNYKNYKEWKKDIDVILKRLGPDW